MGNIAGRAARRFFISGRVQGVGFRFFAQRAAARHQVTGYVRNLKDGRVEAYAEGPPAAIEGFKHELAAGPTFSEVEQVEELHQEPTGNYPLFRVEQ